MEKRTIKKTGDLNQIAFRVAQAVTSDSVEEARKPIQFPATARKKNPAAVALGKLGAQKGGRARAAKLSAEKRKTIAQRAAQARWAKSK